MRPDASTDAKTGWVYRSDPSAVSAKPDALAPPAAPAAAVTPPRPAATPPRPAPQPRPPADSPAPTPSRGWVERSLQMMTVPVAITAGVMLAPMIWMFATRPRR